MAICLGFFLVSGAQSKSLEEAFRELKTQAEERSPEMEVARAHYEQKAAQTYTAWARWLPQANLVLNQNRGKDYTFLSAGGPLAALAAGYAPPETTQDSWNLGVQMPLYRRSVHLQISQSHAELDQAESELDAKDLELDWKLRSLLGDLLVEHYRALALRTSTEIARTQRKDAQLRFELGQKTRVDVLRSQANVGSLESQGLESEEKLLQAQRALLDYSGLAQSDLTPLSEFWASEQTLEKALQDFAWSAEPLWKKVEAFLDPTNLQRRHNRAAESPALQALFARERVGEAQAASLMSGEWPELSLKASIGHSGTDWSTALRRDPLSYNVGFTLSIPLFSGGTLVSSYFEKAGAQEANRVSLTRERKAFFDELDDVAIRLRTLVKTVESQRQVRDQNEEILRLSLKSFELGKLTSVEFLNAQNELLSSKINLARSRVQYAVLLRRFASQLGVSLR